MSSLAKIFTLSTKTPSSKKCQASYKQAKHSKKAAHPAHNNPNGRERERLTPQRVAMKSQASPGRRVLLLLLPLQLFFFFFAPLSIFAWTSSPSTIASSRRRQTIGHLTYPSSPFGRCIRNTRMESNNANNNNNNNIHNRKQLQNKDTTTTTTTAMFSTSAGAVVADSNDDYDDEKAKKKLQKQRRRRISVFAILVSAFLNLLGFTMAGPITPALGLHFDLPIGASFGSLTSAYPLGMLFGLFVWPALSDRLGRKPIIASSLLGSGLGLVAQAMVIQKEKSLAWFLACRAFTGAFAGSSPVSKAYLADIGYRDGKLPRYLALRDAASTMAFIVGPMLGGILYDVRRRMIQGASEMTQLQVLTASGSLAFVIAISAAASLVAAALVGLLVQDVKPASEKKKKKEATESTTTQADDGSVSSTSTTSTAEDIFEEELVACPLGRQMWAGVASVCVVSFLFNVGDSTFHAFFSALLKDAAGKATVDIGLLYTLLACVSFVVSTTGSSWLMKSVGPVITCALGLGFVGSGLSALGLAAASQVPMIPPRFAVLAAAAAVYYCGVPLYGPTIPTMLLRCVPSNRRGTIMGLDGTINTIARIISPLVMGDIYRRFGAGAAFGLAGAAVFGGALTALLRRFVVLRDLYADSSTSKKEG